MFMVSTEALEFAQNKLTPFGKEKSYVEKLEVCPFLRKLFQAYLTLPFLVNLVGNEKPYLIAAGLYGSSCL